jgi:hypothetical protein
MPYKTRNYAREEANNRRYVLIASLQTKRDCPSEIDRRHHEPCQFYDEVETLQRLKATSRYE